MTGPAAPLRPPLWTWGAAVALALATLGALALWAALTDRSYMSTVLNLDRIAALPPGTPYVALIGSSTTGCGVVADAEATRLLHADGAPAAVITFSLARSRFDDFGYAFDAIARRPARLVLIDQDFMTYGRIPFPPPGEQFDADWAKKLRKRVRVALHLDPPIDPGPYEFNHPRHAGPFCSFPPWGSPKDVAAYVALMSRRKPTTPRDQDRLLAHIHALQAAGVTVALFRPPRSPLAALHFPPALQQAGQRILARQLAANRLTIVGPAPALPTGDFADEAHLTPAGRVVYSRWLMAEIARRLAPPQP